MRAQDQQHLAERLARLADTFGDVVEQLRALSDYLRPPPTSMAEIIPAEVPEPDSLTRHVLLWHLPRADYTARHAEFCETPLKDDEEAHLRHAAELTRDDEVHRLLGPALPDVATAVCGIRAIARHGDGLGQIQVAAGPAKPFLTALDPEAFWADLYEPLKRLASTPVPRPEQWRVLDSTLRTLVRIESGDGPRVGAPADDSVWSLLLGLSLGRLLTFGRTHSPALVFGHVAPGTSMNDAPVDRQLCRWQKPPVHTGEQIVVWCFNAWYGRDTGIHPEIVREAEVVWEG